MATNTNLKAALSFPADPLNPFVTGGRTVGNAELVRVQAWFEAEYAAELNGRDANANDFAAWLWRQVAGKVKNHERKVAEAAVTAPSELDEV